MADVFLSYRNLPDRRELVDRLAAILEAHGLEVWWDYGLEAGLPYREQIMAELEKAKVVIPLWCSESVTSEWVLKEAALGREKLMPIRLQRVAPPEEFEALQAADLTSWNGNVDHDGLQRLVGSIAARAGVLLKPRLSLIGQLRQLPALSPLAYRATAGLSSVSHMLQPRPRGGHDSEVRSNKLPEKKGVGLPWLGASWLFAGVCGASADNQAVFLALAFGALCVVAAMFAAREFFYLGYRQPPTLIATLVVWGLCAIPCWITLFAAYSFVLNSTSNSELGYTAALSVSAIVASSLSYLIGRSTRQSGSRFR